jgi:hypothetical protein
LMIRPESLRPLLDGAQEHSLALKGRVIDRTVLGGRVLLGLDVPRGQVLSAELLPHEADGLSEEVQLGPRSTEVALLAEKVGLDAVNGR